jgi:hypothetical protein
MPGYEVVLESRIVGGFRGYRCGRVYELADGSRWRQEGTTNEYVLRTNPAARILSDGDGHYHDVEGTSHTVATSGGVKAPRSGGAN